MRYTPRIIPLTALSLATVALISACGGGGSSSTSGVSTLAGKVIDGYITGATVCLDLNSNRVCDSGEPSAVTGTNGAYSLTAPAGVSLAGLHLIVSIPTTATDSDAPGVPIARAYTMLAPAEMPTVISPLTTAVSARMINGESLANARIGARTDLSLPGAYDFASDHIATSNTAAQNVAKVVAAYLAVDLGANPPTGAALTAGLVRAKAGSAAAYASTNVSGTVSGILGTPTPTPTPTPAPAPSGTSIVSFDETTLPTLGAFGDASPSIATAPAGGTGAALSLARSGAINYGGTYFNVATPIPFAANRKTVTARVYSTRANAVVYLKVEAPGGVATEVSATTAAANTWQTLTWVLSGVNPTNSYSTVVFSADTDVAGSGAQTYWVDEVTLAAASVASPTPTPTPTPAGGPIAAAAVPTASAANAKSIFSDSYTNVIVDEWGPDWGPSSSRVTDGAVASNNYKTIDITAGKTFAGISFASQKFDATTYTTFNMDYWIDTPIPAGQVISIKLSNHDGANETSAIESTVTSITGGSWQRISIPLSSFTQALASLSRNNIAQVVLTGARADPNQPVKLYIDNLYFGR